MSGAITMLRAKNTVGGRVKSTGSPVWSWELSEDKLPGAQEFGRLSISIVSLPGIVMTLHVPSCKSMQH